jgi:hypothetical protein
VRGGGLGFVPNALQEPAIGHLGDVNASAQLVGAPPSKAEARAAGARTWDRSGHEAGSEQ